MRSFLGIPLCTLNGLCKDKIYRYNPENQARKAACNEEDCLL